MTAANSPTGTMEPANGLDLSIVVPCYRSGEWLPTLVERIERAVRDTGRTFEIVLVNDASPDRTWQVISDVAARHESVLGLNLLSRVGQQRATLCGIQHSRGTLVLTMDDDLQHLPEDIPTLLEAYDSLGDVDCVIGRFPQKHHTLYRNVGSSIVGFLNWCFYRKPRHLKLTAFRLMNRATADTICRFRTAKPVLGVLLLRTTHRIVNVDVRHRPREQGRSGWTYVRLISTVIDNIISGSTAPLKAVAIVGLLCATGSAFLGARYLLLYYLGRIAMPGFTTQVLLITFFGGMTLLSIGLLGEYVSRLVQEATAPPLFVVRDRTDRTGDTSATDEPLALSKHGGDDGDLT